MQRDIPLGILFFVLGAFAANTAYFLVGDVGLWKWVGIYVFVLFADWLFCKGWEKIIGSPKSDSE